MRILAAVGLLLASAAAAPAQVGSEPRFELEVEGGATWQSRNDVEIPNDGTATRFSLRDLVGSGPWPAGRVTLTWNAGRRHGIRLLAAPLRYTETGAFDRPVGFAGETYRPGDATEATYRFDSWRVSYRYRFKRSERWSWWVGLTAKLRDAEVRLRQGATTSRDTDLGFVPLLHVRGEWRPADRWRLTLELDALAGGPGRAEDVSLKLGYDVGERWQLAAGYRLLEGGADVARVYNFAWFNYAVLSARYSFGGRSVGQIDQRPSRTIASSVRRGHTWVWR